MRDYQVEDKTTTHRRFSMEMSPSHGGVPLEDFHKLVTIATNSFEEVNGRELSYGDDLVVVWEDDTIGVQYEITSKMIMKAEDQL